MKLASQKSIREVYGMSNLPLKNNFIEITQCTYIDDQEI